jgi:ectoine hydroxylase
MRDYYPTRNKQSHAILKRQEPVAWRKWQKETPISLSQYNRWCEDGYLVMDDLFQADEIVRLTAEAHSLQENPAVLAHETAITEMQGNELRSLFRPQDFSQCITEAMHHPRLLALAEFLLASPVYLHQTRINFKPAFHGKDFWWHSDFETWHAEDGLPAMRTISISISLTDNTEHNGPLLLIPGSHRSFVACPGETPSDNFRTSLREQVLGTPDEISLKTLAKRGIDAATGRAGSVTIFDCNTMHGSGSNITPWPRSNLFFVYNSILNTPIAPFCGQTPRPSFVAERENFTPLRARNYSEEQQAIAV